MKTKLLTVLLLSITTFITACDDERPYIVIGCSIDEDKPSLASINQDNSKTHEDDDLQFVAGGYRPDYIEYKTVYEWAETPSGYEKFEFVVKIDKRKPDVLMMSDDGILNAKIVLDENGENYLVRIPEGV